MKFCTKCGNRTAPGAKFCGECGSVISAPTSFEKPALEDAIQPLPSPAWKLPIPQEEAPPVLSIYDQDHDKTKVPDQPHPGGMKYSESIGQTEMTELFVGKKYEYYRLAWLNAPTTRSFNSPSLHWNTAAFFGTVLWMSYRKMYRNAAIGMAAFLAITLLQILIEKKTGSFSNAANYGISSGIAGLFAYFGNGIYKKHVDYRVGALILKSANNNHAEIAAAGGVNKIAPWITLVVFFVLYTVLFSATGGFEDI